MKHGRVRLIGVAAIHAAGRNDADRHALFHHRPDLYRRRVRPQQVPAGEVERVVHRACRMVFRDIQRGEVVEIVFDLGSGPHAESRVTEDLLDPEPGAGDRMPSAESGTAAGQRDIDRIRREPGCQGIRFERLTTRIETLLDGLLGLVDGLTGLWPILRREGAEALEQRRKLSLLSEIGNAHRIERGQLGCRVDFGVRRRNELLDFLHAAKPLQGRRRPALRARF